MEMKLKTKLMLALLSAGLLPLFIAGIVINDVTTSALEDNAFNQLISVSENKQNHIEDYFKQIRNQILTFSEDAMIVQAMKEYKEAFWTLPEELNIGEEDIGEYRKMIMEYYTDHYAKEFKDRTGREVRVDNLLPNDEYATIVAQYLYIANNPRPLGEKDSLNAASD